MKKIFKKSSILNPQSSILIIVTFLFFFSISIVLAAWSEPTAAPGGAYNTPEPINTSSSVQTKIGSLNISGFLGVGGILDVASKFIFDPSVGIKFINKNILLEKEGNTSVPGSGPIFTLQSPSSNISAIETTSGVQCGTNCPTDNTADTRGNKEDFYYNCSGNVEYGKEYTDKYLPNGVDRNTANYSQYYSSHNVKCIAGTASYSILVDDGSLLFKNSGNITNFSLDQNGTSTFSGSVKATEFIGSGEKLTGIPFPWIISGNNIYNNNTGNVGIGTNMPINKLSVLGSIGLLRNPGADIRGGPGSELQLQSPSSDVVGSNTGWTECGSTASSCPSETLPNSAKNTESAYTCLNSDSGSTYIDVAKIQGSSNYFSTTLNCLAGTSLYSLRTNNGSLEFLNNNSLVRFVLGQDGAMALGGPWGRATTTMTLTAPSATSGGNVGIGTTNPIDKLVQTGNIRMRSADSRIIGLNNDSAYNLGTSGGAAIRFLAGGTVTGGSDEIAFETHKNGVSHEERMRIASTGNVGIGTTSPGAPLSLGNRGSVRTMYTYESSNTVRGFGNDLAGIGYEQSVFWPDSGTIQGGITFGKMSTNGAFTYTPRMFIRNDGNVGIGTTDPKDKLHVVGGIRSSGSAADYNDGDQLTMDYNVGTSRINARNSLGTAVLTFLTNNTERMRIASTGNVGIGTTSPNGKLTINAKNDGIEDAIAIHGGSSSASKYGILNVHDTNEYIRLGYFNGSAMKKIFLDGNVGIGTTSPRGRLEVNINGAAIYWDGVVGNYGADTEQFMYNNNLGDPAAHNDDSCDGNAGSTYTCDINKTGSCNDNRNGYIYFSGRINYNRYTVTCKKETRLQTTTVDKVE